MLLALELGEGLEMNGLLDAVLELSPGAPVRDITIASRRLLVAETSQDGLEIWVAIYGEDGVLYVLNSTGRTPSMLQTLAAMPGP